MGHGVGSYRMLLYGKSSGTYYTKLLHLYKVVLFSYKEDKNLLIPNISVIKQFYSVLENVAKPAQK